MNFDSDTSTDQILDLQVNGYNGVDFNGDRLKVDECEYACETLLTHGVSQILATVITASPEQMQNRISNLYRVRNQSPLIASVIAGIHVEGPFINRQPGFVGAHPPEFTQPANLEVMKQLLDAGQGLVKLVTIAPEMDAHFEVIRFLVESGVRVSAGHCDPSLELLAKSIAAGVTMFTHLGNGCPLNLHRHDNVIQRVLSKSDQLAIGFIADGVHLPFYVLANFLRITGFDRAFVVTDAIAAAGKGPGRFKLGNQDVVVDENLATWTADKSNLVGSAITMPSVVRNLREKLGLSDEHIRMLTIDNPRKALGMEVGS